ncbi:MAG: hypothetical protein IIY69_06175 [Clostridia bacterium]|nr:hypothetical protein [Clostridia bacterium]
MKVFLRLMIAMMVLASVFISSVGCGETAGKDVKPSPSEEANEPVLTDAQKDNILKLAKAFYKFGDVDLQKGIELTRVDGIIRCYYEDILDESETAGYGRIEKTDADAFIKVVFNGIELTDMVRTQYKPDSDQEYFYLNGYYYVKLAKQPVIGADIISTDFLKNEKGNVYGVNAIVSVNIDGVEDAQLNMQMAFSDGDELSVLKSETNNCK